MNKENRDIIVKLKVKKDNKVYDLEKQETLSIEEYGKEIKKTISFKLDGKEHKFVITFKPQKGLFGDRIHIGSISQGEFIPEQEPVKIMTASHENTKFKENPWRKEGKILVGFIILSALAFIGFFIWSRRKNKV